MDIPEGGWVVPDPFSVFESSMADGAKIILRRHGNPEGPRLVLCHGNGFAMDMYYPFWSLLMDDFDLIMYDLRNHGWNPRSSIRNHNLPVFVRDYECILKEIDRNFGRKPKVGVFHSISAMIPLISPTKGEEFSALILFDPPICCPGRSYADFEKAAQTMSAMARNRVAYFSRREEFEELLPYSPVLQNVLPGVYRLMAETTLRKRRKGYELCCPPEYEAQIVEYASNFAVLVDFSEIRCSVKVLGSDPTLAYSYLPTFDLTHVVRANYDFLPESSHLLQLEQPRECVAVVRKFLKNHGSLNP